MRRSRLEHAIVEKIVQRHVERIDPYDPLVAFVNVLVPGPARGQDHVAALHRAGFAVDHRNRARRRR